MAAIQVQKMLQSSHCVVTVEPGQPVAEAAERMAQHNVGALVVVQDGALVGIVSERDITEKVVARRLDPGTVPVEQIMTRRLVSCGLDTSIGQAQQIMAVNGIRHLPVVEQGAPVAMISSRDIMAHELSAVRSLAIRQSRILSQLEGSYPGITHMTREMTGPIAV